jgi:prepilin-type N-terminal cleavage/methylation domain-containing protein
MKMKRSNRGLTLIEVLIASVILVVISLAIYLLIERGSSTYATASRHAALQASARQIVERLCEEVRVANPLTMIGTTTYTNVLDPSTGTGFLSFQKAETFDIAVGTTTWGPTVTYTSQPSAVDLDNDGNYDDAIVRTCLEDLDGDGTPETLVTSKLSDYVKKGSFVVTYTPAANKVTVAVTLMLTDTKGKVVTTTVSSTVIVRNPG